EESKEDFAPAAPPVEQSDFATTLDKCFDEFLGKTGWQGMDPPNIVAEFVRFAKKQVEPSSEDLKEKAKANSQAKNAGRKAKEHRSDMQR
ncbi:MAG: hypothetical protein IKV56_04550, partial [Kiritimatiellae bacterium]|nr:hypothetical protein [Kiritimatiellia bacterium]